MNILKRDIVDYIISEKPKFVAHGCNCQKVMGGGVAKRLASVWAGIEAVDSFDNRQPYERLGCYTKIRINSNTTVYNFYTQLHPGPNFNPSAFIICLQKFVIENSYIDDIGNLVQPHLTIPMIGNGLGKNPNWPWEATEEALIKYVGEENVTILDY
jgi:hypothetical protein